MIGFNKQRVSALMRGLRDTTSLPEGWSATDADVARFESVITQVANKQRLLVDDRDIKSIVEDCFRCDTKTHRAITQGYMICGERYFAEEADAVEWFNNNGVACTTFDEGALLSESMQWYKADWTYWMQWYDKEHYEYVRN